VVEKIRGTTQTYRMLAAEHARHVVANGRPYKVS
jgi:hypothetical protein